MAEVGKEERQLFYLVKDRCSFGYPVSFNSRDEADTAAKVWNELQAQADGFNISRAA